MSLPELVMQFRDERALQAHHERDFSYGRALVPGSYDLSVFSRCVLTLVHPLTQQRLQIPSQVVMVLAEGADTGVALQFEERSVEARERLQSFVQSHGETADSPGDGAAAAHAEPEMQPTTEDEPSGREDDELTDEHHEAASSAQRAIVEARAAKLRNLTPPQRIQVARSSVLEERVLLERIYGSAVWELLLRNPKITIPEVARLARKGTMPRPLLDEIAENEQWIRHSLVRRALLSNPRLGPDAIARVLRVLPPRELRLVPQQTAYPNNVRQAATRLMRG